MSKYNFEQTMTVAAIALGMGAILGAIVGGSIAPAKKFCSDNLTVTPVVCTSGHLMYYAMYDDGKYTFEALDDSRAAAVDAVRRMVLA